MLLRYFDINIPNTDYAVCIFVDSLNSEINLRPGLRYRFIAERKFDDKRGTLSEKKKREREWFVLGHLDLS